MSDLFFELLQAGIWGERCVNMSVFEDYVYLQKQPIPWSIIYSTAEQQDVIGPITDGISKYSESLSKRDYDSSNLVFLKPSKMDMRPFITKVVSLEDRHRLVESIIIDINRCLSSTGIEWILVKGLELAELYPITNHRHSCDIDLMVPFSKYAHAVSVLTGWADEVIGEETNDLEYKLLKEGICIELHGTANMRVTGRMDRLLNSMKEDLFSNSLTRSLFLSDATEIKIPSVMFDAVYITSHLLHHFYKGGIGLKSYCDWAVFVSTFRDTIDVDTLKILLNKMDLMEEWKGLGDFAFYYLGLDWKEIPCVDVPNRVTADKLMSFIGNGFGRKRAKGVHENFWQRKTSALRIGFYDIVRAYSIFPKSSVKALCYLLIDGGRRAIKGL